jgi:hypothetical protein
MKRSATWVAGLGYSAEQREDAISQLREAILDAARDRRMTNYTEVSAAITAIPVDPHSPVLSHLLGEVLEEAHDTTGLALTALVTHKYGDLEPGGGFYKMARKAGFKFSDPHEFWWRNVEAIFKKYGRQ